MEGSLSALEVRDLSGPRPLTTPRLSEISWARDSKPKQHWRSCAEIVGRHEVTGGKPDHLWAVNTSMGKEGVKMSALEN